MVLDTEIIYDPFGETPSRTVRDKLMEVVSVKDFGATGLISDNATTKIQAAIDYAATDGNFNKTVFFPNGIYNVNATITVPQGIMLKGEGSQGSNQSFGTVIRHNENGDCFHFSGEGIANAGTGGGMENFLIVKTGSYSTGTAIFIEAQSTDNRPGEMLMTNILVYGADNGKWTHGMVVDGTAANTNGTRGVRSVHCRKCRFAEVTSINQTVVLDQVSHFFAQGLQIETGDAIGVVIGGLTIRGISNGIFIDGLNAIGNLVINTKSPTTFSNHVHISGKLLGELLNDDNSVDGIITLSGILPGSINKSKSLKLMNSRMPYVRLRLGQTQPNVTGLLYGQLAKVYFNNIFEDATSNYSYDSGVFTCKLAGGYQFDYAVTLSGIESTHTRYDVGLYVNDINRYIQVGNPGAMATPISNGGFITLTGSISLNLNYGDDVSLCVKVAGNSQTVDIYGSNSTAYTYMTVRYVT